MNGTHLVVVAASLAIAGLATAVHAQTMYRCGNSYQDKPCDDGRGKVVGSTKSPAPVETTRVCVDGKCRDVPVTRTQAASANPAARSMRPLTAEEIQLVGKARKCQELQRDLARQPARTRDAFLTELRRQNCATRGSQDRDIEQRCATAIYPDDVAQSCGEYAKLPEW